MCFHEAIGTKHLQKIGLMDSLVEDEELDINFLMSQALITVNTLPFHLVNDLWRWRVFHGDYEEKEWNAEYWRLKRDIVGVAPPGERPQEEAWLDPPTLFHINQDYDMIRYFTRYRHIGFTNYSLIFIEYTKTSTSNSFSQFFLYAADLDTHAYY